MMIVRIFAHFLRPEGTGEYWFWPLAYDSLPILSIENRFGALRPTLFSGATLPDTGILNPTQVLAGVPQG